MEITFFDDPMKEPKPPAEVRIRQLGLYVYEDGRRVAFGLELTPFRERPSIEVQIVNARNEPAGSLSVIEQLSPNFSLTLHLRDDRPSSEYRLTASIYYATPGSDRHVVDQMTVSFDAAEPGETIFKPE